MKEQSPQPKTNRRTYVQEVQKQLATRGTIQEWKLRARTVGWSSSGDPRIGAAPWLVAILFKTANGFLEDNGANFVVGACNGWVANVKRSPIGGARAGCRRITGWIQIYTGP